MPQCQLTIETVINNKFYIGPVPSKLNIIAKAKYDAWKAQKGVSKEDA